jgi:hypothetical protein
MRMGAALSIMGAALSIEQEIILDRQLHCLETLLQLVRPGRLAVPLGARPITVRLTPVLFIPSHKKLGKGLHLGDGGTSAFTLNTTGSARLRADNSLREVQLHPPTPQEKAPPMPPPESDLQLRLSHSPADPGASLDTPWLPQCPARNFPRGGQSGAQVTDSDASRERMEAVSRGGDSGVSGKLDFWFLGTRELAYTLRLRNYECCPPPSQSRTVCFS